ncbi:MAG: electron transport complex subunit RsxC, partial [Psychrobium sp.]|nr:electron transport complex subunit RsxC [Psychrobium sp.]
MKTIIDLVDDGQLWRFHGGVHPPSRKDRTQDQTIINIDLPDTLYIPLAQHAGQPAICLVKVGQRVVTGETLARKEGFISANILAPATGTIADITLHASSHASGLPTETIILRTDLVNTSDQTQSSLPMSLLPTLSLDDDKELFIKRIEACGITGLGGASFPTAIKMAPRKSIDFLIINAVECEPYITSDDALMRQHAEQIIDGIAVMNKILQPQRIIIAIEDNKPHALSTMQQAAKEWSDQRQIIVRAIPTIYPTGGEKQLIEVLTGLQVPSGKIPADVGVVMQNIATTYAVGQAVLSGQALLNRIVTVTGDLVSAPGNYRVPLGMSINALLTHCGFKEQASQKIIMGGAMMGFALHDINAPVVKATNCIIAASDVELPNAPQEQACIRCGDCEQVCPAQLLPQQLQWFAKDQDHQKLQQHNLFDCIECGACAYVCPSSIPLVQYYRVAKAEIREVEHEKHLAQRAKERFEQRQARLERDKLERLEKNRLAAEKRKQAMSKSNDGDAIAAAMARIKAKKTATTPESGTGNVASASQPKDRVAAAIARAKAKKAAALQSQDMPANETQSSEADEKKSRVAAAIARAKAKKSAAMQSQDVPASDASTSVANASNDSEVDEKKVRVAAAIDRAKAKKAAAKQSQDVPETDASATD